MGVFASETIGLILWVLSTPSLEPGSGGEERPPGSPAGDLAHALLLTKSEFPSAQECSVCHPDHFREWSVSPHAYAQLSPTFNTLAINPM